MRETVTDIKAEIVADEAKRPNQPREARDAGQIRDESISAPAAPEKRGEFNVDVAYNTAGFLEFLNNHPDSKSLDMSDAAMVEKRFEAFNAAPEAAEKLQKVFAEHLKKEIGLDVPEEKMKAVIKRMEKFAVEDPDGFMAYKSRLDSFEPLKDRIAGQEAHLKELGDASELEQGLENLKDKQERIASISAHAGRFGRLRLWKTMIVNRLPRFDTLLFPEISVDQADELQERLAESNQAETKIDTIKGLEKEHGGITLFEGELSGVSAEVDSSIEGIEKTLAKIESMEKHLETSKKLYGDIRTELVSSLSDYKQITEFVQNTVKDTLESVFVTGDMSHLERLQDTFLRLQGTSARTETGIDYLGGMDVEAFGKQLNEAVEAKAFEEIQKAVNEVKPGNNHLYSVEKAIEGWLIRQQIGTKKGEEARSFVRAAIEKLSKDPDAGSLSQTKRWILARILTKLSKNAYADRH